MPKLRLSMSSDQPPVLAVAEKPEAVASKKKYPLSDSICDDEVILRELCVVNGINYDKLHQGIALKVKTLEIFFFGCPRLPLGLDQFPNLQTLCIMNQRFDSMRGLESCPLLEELWICETQLKKIEGLDHCHNLTRLYLYSNLIGKIEGLTGLKKLQKLWINGNELPNTEGLQELYQLKDLNLADNQISTIGNSLNHLSKLEVLNLSGNKIASLQELVHLSSLPNLNSLSLCHPMHSPNPVCCLCNYSTHTLYHFPQLKWLDGREVASQDLHKLVQGLVLRKIQYYRMKTHHCLSVGNYRVRQLQEKLTSHLEDCHVKLRNLSKHLKFVNGSSEHISDKLSKLVSLVTCHMDRAKEICSTTTSIIKNETNQKCQFWMMELNSGGNVKLTSCLPSQPSFNSCSELVHSRFSVADVENLGISGLEVTEVVRVENRLLFNGFNDKLKTLLALEPYVSMTASQLNKKMVDYLFLVWQPDTPSIIDTCLRGFGPPTSVPLWLSNSVNIADHLHLTPQQRKVESGKLLLCKVFTGQASETTAQAIPSHTTSGGADSVYRVHGPSNQANSTDLYSKDWYIFDTSLVLPEYIMSFKYLSPHFPEDPLQLYISSHLLPEDDVISSLAPKISSCPRLAMLDECTLLEVSGHSSLSAIQELNICNNRLTRFRLASCLPQLTSLVLSGNELSIAEDFCNLPNLEILDLSFNKLASLQGMKALPRLSCLNISWNYLTNYHENLGPLRKHCPSLEDLDTRHNCWSKPEYLREYVIGRIKTLHSFDGHLVTPEESSAAVKNVVSSHLTLTTLVGHAYTSANPLPSLSMAPVAETLCQSSSLHINSSLGMEWNSKVTAVNLCNLGLRKLAHLDQLPNLRWLAVTDNCLISLEGLVQCTSLEELTLDNNLIQTIEGIGNLCSLKWLSLSGNQLSELSNDIWGLSKLRYLNLSSNSISSLHQLKQLTSLMELYVSVNLVCNLRELFSLKTLSSLIVLDLSLSPIASKDTYRPFVIFHLNFLKALDGRPIDVGEIAGAKEKLGGQLTQDFIFQKYPSLHFKEMVKLDLPNCGLKHIDLSPVDSFPNLASLNLENNSLTSFSGLVFLSRLKVLCLNHNRIEQLFAGFSEHKANLFVLHNLQVLHLAYNGISSLPNLQLNRIPSLKALFLQGNEISKVEGLDELSSLTELVLDRNKIKNLQEQSLAGLHNLKELHIEENRLRDLSHFYPLPCLERLYLGLNRIQDYNQLEKIKDLHNLRELSIISNPVSRRLQHRAVLIYQHPALTCLDGVSVSAVERQAAEMVFGAEHEDTDHSSDSAILPGLSGATPLRVMNVPFGRNYQQRRQSSADSRTFQGHFQNVRGFHDKRKRGKNS